MLPPSRPKRRPSRKIILAIAGGLLLLCLVCGVGAVIFAPEQNPTQVSKANPTQPAEKSSAQANAQGAAPETPTMTPTRAPTRTPQPTKTRAPTRTPAPTSTPDPSFVDIGTYLVGSDIEPGLYKGQAGNSIEKSCYWERLKDLSGSFESILANANSVGQFYVEVVATDFALALACPMHRIEYDQLTPNPSEKITAGTYLVNIDILPGLYRGEAGSDISQSCYWERLVNLRGTFDSILANDNATGQFFVQVSQNDFALKTACDLERISD